MRLGVVSDTHDRRPNVERILTQFEAARVDAVLHTGDVTLPSTLELFGRLGVPLYGVLGNNDHDRDGLHRVAKEIGMRLADEVLEVALGDRRIVSVHDPEDVDLQQLYGSEGAPDLMLHGHTHRHRWEKVGGTWVFNPGECAGAVEGLGAVGVVDLSRLELELLKI